MGLTMKNTAGSAVPLLKAGTYIGTCIGVIDLGLQRDFYHDGKYNDQVLLIWEIKDEYVTVEEDGKQVEKPRWLSRRFTASCDPRSNLAKAVMAWRGISGAEELRGFQLPTLLGTGCQLQVQEVDRKDGSGRYNSVGAVVGLPKGIQLPQALSELFLYDLENPDDEVFDKLPEWIRNTIKESRQYQENTAGSKPIDIPMDMQVDAETGEILSDGAPF